MGEMTFGPPFWALAGLGIVAAVAYGLVFLTRPPSLLRALVKTLFMGAFAGALISAGAPSPLVFAAIASALGDFFLAFERKWLLPFGILSFLLAQLAYLVIFFFSWMFAGDISPLWPRYLALALTVAATIAFLIWMAPRLGWVALGVVPYAIAITAMCAAAMWLPWFAWPAMIGAASFLVSDFVLAVELFRLPRDAPIRRITGPVVWWTYAAAQTLIIWGVASLVAAG
jgi:uncharacterized membrane protein YhhN